MNESIFLGMGRHMLPVPRLIWQRQLHSAAHLDFMSQDHHRVRNLVVCELPRAGKPLAPEFIAQALGLPADQVVSILDDLERHMTFLFRNEQGAVVWAYPVTVEPTPHRVTFSTGEHVYAA
jgi:hypothetical protein